MVGFLMFGRIKIFFLKIFNLFFEKKNFEQVKVGP
jgi:hypothetical protein